MMMVNPILNDEHGYIREPWQWYINQLIIKSLPHGHPSTIWQYNHHALDQWDQPLSIRWSCNGSWGGHPQIAGHGPAQPMQFFDGFWLWFPDTPKDHSALLPDISNCHLTGDGWLFSDMMSHYSPWFTAVSTTSYHWQPQSTEEWCEKYRLVSSCKECNMLSNQCGEGRPLVLFWVTMIRSS